MADYYVQQDRLVKDYLLTETDEGKEVVDRLRIPALDKALKFQKKKYCRTTTEKVIVPALVDKERATADKIADMIIETVFAKKRAFSFYWTARDGILELEMADQGKLVPNDKLSKDDLKEVLCNALRSRNNPTSLRWIFGKPYMEISYVISGIRS